MPPASEIRSLLVWNAVIMIATLAGGTMPLLRRWSQRALHLFIALAAGVFLGAVFLHLLPELAAADPPPSVAALVPITIVALFAVERLAIRKERNGAASAAATGNGPGDERTHAVVAHATLLGLVIHSLAGGFGLAVGGGAPDLQLAIFLSILGHKTAEAFSLATVLLLGGRRTAQVLLPVALLALMTPTGCLIGFLSLLILPGGTPLAPLAIAAGAFLYVALLDLLPEVLHHHQDIKAKVLLMLSGLAWMGLLRGAH